MKSGDAICLRYGNLSGGRDEQTVIVIDGGDKAAGEAMVAHIKAHYGTDDIDYVVSTHPDADHASGLAVVMEEMNITGALLMHRPWEHAPDIKDAFSDGRWTDRGLEEKIQKSLTHAHELEAIAERRGIKIIEPFQGVGNSDRSIRVLGPSKEFYQEMLVNFRSTPTPKTESGLLNVILQKGVDAVKYVEDTFDIDILDDDTDTTSAENNTSVIMLLTIGDKRLLFTGDAGKTALLHATTHAEGLNIPLTGMAFLDVPHHGSRRNINSKILKKISADVACVSATGENPKHPSKRVTNALKKNGAKVYVTRKEGFLHHFQGNSRGWGAAAEEVFHTQVED